MASKDGLITLAGINSSQANQDAGKNEHFRSFAVKYPPRKKPKTEESVQDEEGKIELLGKRSLFKQVAALKSETYQRLLRLSPARQRDTGAKRLGAISTGLAKKSEIVVFNATASIPEPADIVAKLDLPENGEACDLDINETDQSEFSLAYCDEYNIYEQTFTYDFAKKKVEKRPKGPRRIHQMPFPDAMENPKSRPKFRCLRFLDGENLVALVNKPNKGGAEIRVYHMYPTGPAIEVQKKKLPYHIRQASGMDVCALDAQKNGDRQVVVAIAGQDISIEIFTTNFQSQTSTFSSFSNYITLKEVHGQQMTKLCFAPFHSPPRVSSSDDQKATGQSSAPRHPGPQTLRLASVSYGNTVVVDTFPLSPFDPSDKDSRYVLSHPGDEVFWWWAYFIIGSLVVVVTAFLFQSFMFGFAENDRGLFGLLPANVREFLDTPAGRGAKHYTLTTVSEPAVPGPTPVEVVTAKSGLRDAIAEHHGTPEDAQTTAVIVRDIPDDTTFDVHIHPDKETYLQEDTEAKHWHELEPHQRAYWKEKLIKAGQWAEHEGESILQGVLWSTYAGIVGDVAGEILREL